MGSLVLALKAHQAGSHLPGAFQAQKGHRRALADAAAGPPP